MKNWFPVILGYFMGRGVGNSNPKGLFVVTTIVEAISLVLAFSGNAIGGVFSAITGILLAALGIRCGAGPIRCLVCGFFQFFFVLGILVVPGSGGIYLLLHFASLAYPVTKALRWIRA